MNTEDGIATVQWKTFWTQGWGEVGTLKGLSDTTGSETHYFQWLARCHNSFPRHRAQRRTGGRRRHNALWQHSTAHDIVFCLKGPEGKKALCICSIPEYKQAHSSNTTPIFNASVNKMSQCLGRCSRGTASHTCTQWFIFRLFWGHCRKRTVQ